MPHLTTEELDQLEKAAIDSGLVDMERSKRLRGIRSDFIITIKTSTTLLDHFLHELNALNRAERLADGSVPIVRFLTNAARDVRMSGHPAEADLFERLANEISNRTGGVAGLPEPAALPEVTRAEAIVGQDDMVDFPFMMRGVTVGKSVARIVVPRFETGAQIMASGRPWIMVGTAWMIATDLAITNHHVINARKSDEIPASDADFALQGKNSVLEFDFDGPNAAKKTVRVSKIEHASPSLDYAIVRLADSPAPLPLALSVQRVQINATSYIPVNIIQHPRGEPKRVAFRNNLVTGADQEIIRYFTDTDFGSSGSPVCDDTWNVVALHRGAKYAQGVKYQGKDTAYVNFGSQIQAVMDDLKQNKASVHQAIIDSQPQV